MDKQRCLDILYTTRIIAIIRAPDSSDLIQTIRALEQGGIRFIEVTMNTPGALGIIEEIAGDPGDVVIGAGTVLDAETARIAIMAGARFIVAPTLNKDVVALCRRYSVIAIPGAFTPTEVLTAWEAGADMVKIFPASTGGPAHLKALHEPLPQIPLCAVCGVTEDTVPDYFQAGATAVALGSSLVKKELLQSKNFSEITSLAGKYVQAAATARG